MRRLTLLFVSVVLVLCAGLAFAQAPTAAGTIIRNTATGSFIPEGTTKSETIASNEVTTEVLPVYNINIEPDGNGTIGTVTQGNGSEAGDPGPSNGSGDPTGADQNDFAGSTPGQTLTGDAGTPVSIPYSLENLSNKESQVLLEVVQDPNDAYNLQNVKIYEDTNGNGVVDPGEPEVTGPITFPASDGTPGSGDDSKRFVVTGTIPANQPGGDVAKVDLVATNQTAVADGADKDNVNNSYQVFENNNIATITVNEKADVGIAKALTAGPTNNGDGTFNATFTYTVENFSNVTLSNVKVTDDFDGIFGVGAVTVVSGTNGTSLQYNTGYDGKAATNIIAGGTLAAGATDAVTVTVKFDLSKLTTKPDASNNYSVSYDNVANVEATTPTGTTVKDDDGSTNGTDPDPDGDGNPNSPGPEDNVPTPVPFKAKPAIAMVKSADVTIDNPATPRYRVAYTVFVENTGDLPLDNVVVTDDLLRAFTELDTGKKVDPANIQIETAPTVTFVTAAPSSAEGDEVVPNAAFDGKGNNNLVTKGTGKLEPGEQFSVSFVVLVTPRDAGGAILDGPFNNQASVTATDPANNPVTDLSDNGSSFDDIDPDGDGLGNEQKDPYDVDGDGTVGPNEGVVNDDGTVGDGTTQNENDPTPVNLGEKPVIGIAKSAGTVTDQGDGSFLVPFTFTVENFGNVTLSKVQVVDDLKATFPAPATFSIVAGSLSSTDFTVNAGFNGDTDKNLLAGTDTLAPNKTGTVTVTVNFKPNGAAGPFNNTAVAEGTSPQGTVTKDDSLDGTDPDGTDNDNNPDEQGPTPVNIPEKAQLGIAKEAAVSANVGTAQAPLFNVTYTVRVENIGNVLINNVKVTDDLKQAFGNAAGFSVTVPPSVKSGKALTPNAAFNGDADKNLVSGSDSLAPGEFSVLQFTVQVNPGSNFGPYDNQAVVTGDNTGPSGGTVTDLSHNGSQVDPDGDGLANEHKTPYDANGDGVIEPNEGVVNDTGTPGSDTAGDGTTTDNNTPTPVEFPEPSEVKLLKDAYVYKSNPSTCDKTTADAAGNALPTNQSRSTNSASGTPTDLETFARPGEYICYVITATNTGAATITKLEIEDAPPEGTFFAISPANGATTQDTNTPTIEIECSTDGGTTYVACNGLDTDGNGYVGNGTEAKVTNVHIKQNPSLTKDQTTTMTFVVYIP